MDQGQKFGVLKWSRPFIDGASLFLQAVTEKEKAITKYSSQSLKGNILVLQKRAHGLCTFASSVT